MTKIRAKRIWQRYSSRQTYVSLCWKIFRLVILIGISFIILYPFVIKVSTMLMDKVDLMDTTVKYIPRNPTLDNILFVIRSVDYFSVLRNTFFLSAACAVLQSIICALIGYGIARFHFKGRGIVVAVILFSIIVPPQSIMISMYTSFKDFDIFGLIQLILGKPINMLDTPLPLLILSLTGFGFKNGLFILIMFQFFKGVPNELEEAAYVDGANVFRTFYSILLPLAVPSMVTILLLSFSWQWTDSFYSSLFFSDFEVMSNLVFRTLEAAQQTVLVTYYSSALTNTAVIMIVLPLVIVYLFGQRFLIQGIERTGIVG